MLQNAKTLSASADEQNENKTRLHSKGKPVFNWIKNSFSNNTKQNISLSNDNLPNDNKENTIQTELKGVQNLKQLWNSRFSAKTSTAKLLSSAKSYGCLLQEQKPPPAVTRALSIHNITESPSTPTVPLPLSIKDNFYKYKTAATAVEKNQCKSTDIPAPTQKRFTSRLNFNFPMIVATQTGEKIHWMRRDDIIVPKKEESSVLFLPETDTKMKTMISPKVVEVMLPPAATPEVPQSQTDIVCDNKSVECNHQQSFISETRDTISSHCSSNSLRSIESTVPRKKNVNTTRKYSFKTQVKSYHSPRKMPYYSSTSASNKVAKLTQQFNEIIQKDKKILNEVKRNNGILISRGGHVYKVIHNSDPMTTESSSSSTGLPSCNESSPNKNISTVQRAIKTFESRTSDKPNVPVKSAKVLRKKKELCNKKEVNIELNSIVLQKIQEEAKNSPKKSPSNEKELIGYQQTENNLNVNQDSIENGKFDMESPSKSKNKIYDKFNLRGMFRKNESKAKASKSQMSLELHSPEKKGIIKENSYSGLLENNQNNKSSAELVKSDDSKVLKMQMKLELKPPEEAGTVTGSQNPSSDFLQDLQDRITMSKLKELEDYKQSYAIETKMTLETKPTESVEIAKKDLCSYFSQNQPESKPSLKITGTEKETIKIDLNSINFTEEVLNDRAEQTFSINDKFVTENIQIAECKQDDNMNSKSQDHTDQFCEVKILNAIEEINNKINSLASCSSDEKFGLVYPPNDSFLYQVNSKIIENEITLSEAVNTSLINFTECQKDNVVDIEDAKAPDEKDLSKSNEEGIYEFISVNSNNITKTESVTLQPQKSFLFCKPKKVNETRNDNQDTCSNYESMNGSCETKPLSDYGYEICETPSSSEQPPPPRPRKESTELQRNTTDKLPELPKPKRIIPKKIFTTVATTDISSRISESGSINEEDDIYDTIKGSPHCYESLQVSRERDTISLTSNGYESINHYRRHQPLLNAESSSTISSDHKTNSLYEVSMLNGMLAGVHSYSHSYITSSENSDEWVDISDSEVNTVDQMGKQQFIVVRERTKCHRSPDWSKRVRDQRLHQPISDDDDVDHYYEPLFPLSDKNYTYKIGNSSTPDIPKGSNYSNNNHYSTDYDSFDTDDDIYEDEETLKKNDSGVDICNIKLPNPPPSKNQVYEFVKKFKNFISIKKSPSDPNKNLADSIQAKMYENTHFQDEENEYQSTLKPTRRAPDKPKTPSTKTKSIKKETTTDENIYENTDFHNAKLKTQSSQPSTGDVTNSLSTSQKNLLAENDVPRRSKSKTGNSFKSRLKSFGSTSFDAKQMSTLTATRSTFYVTDAANNEQDSGIFEKTVSGDNIVTNKSEVEEIESKPVAAVRKNKKETNPSNAFRRRTTIGIRPNDPPPPPPILSDEKSSKKRQSTTSWYAECGVFKIPSSVNNEDGNSEKPTSNLNKSTSSTSWYAEAGLYQTSGVSIASSSGSSGVSTGNEGCISDENGHHVFLNEPLYQIYNAEKLESISRDMEEHESTDGYEEIEASEKPSEKVKQTRPSALQLVGPKSGPSRTLWSEIPEVITSEILTTLTPRERSLQEAKFEIITSEASYLKSLNLLRSHFMNHQSFHDSEILSSRDRRALFSYIAPVHECSEKLLSELENCWQDNIMLLGLSKSIYYCAEKYFHVYVSYCEHQGKMDRTLRKLKEAKGIFCQKLDMLESDHVCCGLTLHSFLMLPMQRITRLPLLIDAVFSKVHPNDDEYENWKLTFAIMNKIVAQCNEAANRSEQAYEIERISRQLDFPSNIRALAIAPVGVAATGSKPRFLVKKGELVHLVWRGDDAKLTFGKKFIKSNIYAFLFSDLMVLTKRKSEEQFTVFDYCPRNMLTISSGDSIPQLPTKDASQTGKNLILMTLLENHERKTVELILSCPSVSELERWLQATRPPEAETPGEKLYEQWDCPQVIAKHEYIANEPDLLSLEVGDVVNVSRKLPDGWFNGERIRDGAVGWFPGSFTEEVNSAHVRARNLKQRYRLLTFTATYLELQKRK